MAREDLQKLGYKGAADGEHGGAGQRPGATGAVDGRQPPASQAREANRKGFIAGLPKQRD